MQLSAVFVVFCLSLHLLVPSIVIGSKPRTYDRFARSLLCPPCEGGNCDVDPSTCPHGDVEDFCGRRVCGKGPGERCGGARWMLGKCADSLQCRCGRCTGCSATSLHCYELSFPCWQ